MPIGHRVRQAKEAQELNAKLRTCKGCPAIVPPERRSPWCSPACYKRNWVGMKPPDYQKRKDEQRRKREQKAAADKAAQIAAILDGGKRASERGKTPNALTTSIVKTGRPPAKPHPTDSIIPPSAREMRDYIHEKYGADGEKLIDLLGAVAFELEGVPIKVRVECVKELLDRGFGKTTQSIAVAAVAPIFAVPSEGADGMLPDLGNAGELPAPNMTIEAETVQVIEEPAPEPMDEPSLGLSDDAAD